ncbi:MAG: PepSY domain-containing protein [Gammaproteobacteria bacterium]|nr:PepSY domain-containing protein [Gammaproteobacteria bacterium]
MQRIVVLVHRYLGIPMSVLFIAWFLSGIVMMYTRGMPALPPDAKRSTQAMPHPNAVLVEPSDAIPRNVALAELEYLYLLGRPAYRYRAFSGTAGIVFADDGEPFTGADADSGRRIAAGYLSVPLEDLSFAALLDEADQWTLTERRHLPMLKFDVRDAAGTSAYVSVSTGDVVMVTTRARRALAWIGAIPHWLYVTPLRLQQPVWYWTVVTLSAGGAVVSLLGLVLSVTGLRMTRPFRLRVSVPYRGLMRWHYFTGAACGVFVLTWVTSGLLSMEPFSWQRQPVLAVNDAEYHGGPLEPGSIDGIYAEAWRANLIDRRTRSARFVRILGEPHWLIDNEDPAVDGPRVVNASTLEPRTEVFAVDRILARLRSATGAGVVDARLITEYDAYYYDREGRLPLPALRVEMDDPARTQFYVDVKTAAVAAVNDRFRRAQRWLFNGLHSLDFPFLYDRRPWWDITLIVLSLAGSALCAISAVLGVRRLRRAIRVR